MAKYTQQDRRTIINWFPALRKDPNFEITSDCTPAYNCIGWALGMNDVWVGIYNPANYAWSWRPKEVRCDEIKESLVELFLYFGFEISDNDLPEDGYDKVALYADDSCWTHAAKIIAPNVYHSKIGTAWDIKHSGGDVFDHTEYGNVFIIMKRRIADRYLTDMKKPQTGRIIIKD